MSLRKDRRVWRGVFEDLHLVVLGNLQTLKGRYTVDVIQLRQWSPQVWAGFIEGENHKAFWLSNCPDGVMDQAKRDFARCLAPFRCGTIGPDGWTSPNLLGVRANG